MEYGGNPIVGGKRLYGVDVRNGEWRIFIHWPSSPLTTRLRDYGETPIVYGVATDY